MKLSRPTQMLILQILAFLLFYTAFVSIVWQIRNPKANGFTFWTHLPDAFLFKALLQFQEKP